MKRSSKQIIKKTTIHGGHLEFLIENVLTIFDVQVTQILPTKFRVDWAFGSGEEAKTDFIIFSSGSHLAHWSKSILAILVESHLGNIPVKFDSNWHRGVGRVVI